MLRKFASSASAATRESAFGGRSPLRGGDCPRRGIAGRGRACAHLRPVAAAGKAISAPSYGPRSARRVAAAANA